MSSQKKLSMSLGEAIFTQRAIRRMKPDPIPLNDIKTFLEAAVKAPNGGNAQPARFVVINERAKIEVSDVKSRVGRALQTFRRTIRYI